MTAAREQGDGETDPARLLRIQLDRVRALRDARASDPGAEALLAAVRSWQTRRLARTYADLAASDRYAPATEFFLSDLYGERDFEARDLSLERAFPLLAKILPGVVLLPVARAIELHALTGELDRALCKALLEDRVAKEAITDSMYAAAYRRCANRPLRLRQIELVVAVGERLDRVVRKPMLQRALKLARRPARSGGFAELQDFLERGFAAFRHMHGAGEFLATIESREKAVLERLFAGSPKPFELEPRASAPGVPVPGRPCDSRKS